MVDRSKARDLLAQEGVDAELFRTLADQHLRLAPETRQVLRRLDRRSARSGRLSPLAYNLTISHRHRFVWFRVAKVGTRTILGHFAKHEVSLDVSHAMRVRYPTELFGDYFKFAFVRHPLHRFVSAWRDKVVNHNYFSFEAAELARMQRIEAFAEWVAGHDLADLSSTDQHIALQARLIDLTQIDYLGRLETFDEDLATICRHIGVPGSDVAVVHQSGSRHDTVSDELRSTVMELYRRDFRVFGY